MKPTSFFSLATISSLLLSSALGFFSTPTFAQTFNPTFSLSIANNEAAINSDVTFTVSAPTGEELPQTVDINMPFGWELFGGASIGQDVLTATGSSSGVYLEKPFSLPINAYNEQDTLGHKARWRIVIGDEPFDLPEGVIYWFWDTNATGGYTISLNSPLVTAFSTPFSLSLRILGNVSGQQVVKNPSLLIAKDYYNWDAKFNYTKTSIIKTIVVSISTTGTGSVEGTTTETGFDVTNNIGDLNIQYSSVIEEGSTTVIATTSQPTAESGLFQVSDGLYYDIDTTAKIECPCKITLPYDPKVVEKPAIYHLENKVWVDVTTDVDTVKYTVTGVVSSLSFFAVGQPNYILEWSENLTEKLTENNPFVIENDDEEDFDFTIFDNQNNWVTPAGVSIEIWQTHDGSGNSIIPVKKSTLTLEIDDKSFESELDLEENPLDFGTYQVRVLVGNTTVTQQIQANFIVVSENDDSGTSISISSED